MSRQFRTPALLLAALVPMAAVAADSEGFTDEFPLKACNFESTGGNAFLNLTVGRQLYLTNQECLAAGDCDELVELWITILPETRVIRFSNGGKSFSVRARVMEEYETADGEG